MNSNKVMSVEQIVNSDEYYLKRKKALDLYSMFIKKYS